MKQYTVKCPLCGHENSGLYLEETRGWFVCEKCKNEVGLVKYMKTKQVPFFKDMNDLAKMVARN